MSISILEDRLKYEIPEEYHQTIEKEFSKFLTETSRMSHEEGNVGQATLTDREVERAPTTNQHGDEGLTVIELQYIKAAALKYGVEDWLRHVDSTLSCEENVQVMRNHGTKTGPTMKELQRIR